MINLSPGDISPSCLSDIGLVSGVKAVLANEVASDDWQGWPFLFAGCTCLQCMYSAHILADVLSAQVYIAVACGHEIMC